jgi:hypothetical protein
VSDRRRTHAEVTRRRPTSGARQRRRESRRGWPLRTGSTRADSARASSIRRRGPQLIWRQSRDFHQAKPDPSYPAKSPLSSRPPPLGLGAIPGSNGTKPTQTIGRIAHLRANISFGSRQSSCPAPTPHVESPASDSLGWGSLAPSTHLITGCRIAGTTTRNSAGSAWE